MCCDAGRGLVLLWLPFIENVPNLIVASFMLELFTLLWSSAKEATVPNLVDREFLPSANSLSLAAAYGTFPVSSAVWATTIATLPSPRRSGRPTGLERGRVHVGRVIRELREGFQNIGSNGPVRAALLGLACGLAGGGMAVPLGPVFSDVVCTPGHQVSGCR